MALTEERLRKTVPTSRHSAEPSQRPLSLHRESDGLSRRWALALPLAWLVAMPLTYLLEPAPASTAPDPWWVIAASNVLLGSIAMTFVGSWLRRRWTGGASLVAASILAAAAIACPVTGHHAFGAWWVAQLAVSVGLVALSGAAALRPSA